MLVNNYRKEYFAMPKTKHAIESTQGSGLKLEDGVNHEVSFDVSELDQEDVRKSIIKLNNIVINDKEEGIRQKFKPYSSIIENLTNNIILDMKHQIISCDWSVDTT